LAIVGLGNREEDHGRQRLGERGVLEEAMEKIPIDSQAGRGDGQRLHAVGDERDVHLALNFAVDAGHFTGSFFLFYHWQTAHGQMLHCFRLLAAVERHRLPPAFLPEAILP